MNERKVHLLNDEDISFVLTGLRLVSSKYISDNDEDSMSMVENLYNRISESYEVGLIFKEKI